jgi:hypothetical protein
MEAVDEPVCLVQLPAQRGSVPAVVRGAADGSTSAAQFRRLEFVRDLGDVLAQFPKQGPRLSCPRVFGHSTIVSPFPNVRATGSQEVPIVAQTSTWRREKADPAWRYVLAASIASAMPATPTTADPQ